ncbi:hypothetical protein [Dendronalium sp. ChiSLP03b]|uniref:hypothetical protein n=1 Tax=Dendronalium sp. ChiSLP03b TaxID=3075381 RepID=UPI002AD24FD9|nr:hypothetical protein [Dendronalium sp. ChiSLP03b]MDZ8206257.1 hypothetical protein [Dendronalium sp. ChiSLP03b]
MEEKSPLFREIPPEESAVVGGGCFHVGFDLDTYMFILGAGILFGNPGLTPEEIQFAWESSFVFESSPRSRRRRYRRH